MYLLINLLSAIEIKPNWKCDYVSINNVSIYFVELVNLRVILVLVEVWRREKG